MRYDLCSQGVIMMIGMLAASILLPATQDELPAAVAAGWHTSAPREEIRPHFSLDPKGGPRKSGCLVITHDNREGLHGWFYKTYPVTGGKNYRFQVVRQV